MYQKRKYSDQNRPRDRSRVNDDYLAEKIIGGVIIFIFVTIVVVILAFKLVFEWTYSVPVHSTGYITSSK